jgi:ParB/RepB/Spo0J family partition protein
VSKLNDILGTAATMPLRPSAVAANGRTAATDVFKIPLNNIQRDPENARTIFTEDELAGLGESLKRHGQITPAIAYALDDNGHYQLIDGERRWRAARAAGLATLTCCIVPRDMADEIKQEIAFVANMCRSNLKPTEIARHWKKLMERWQCTTRELASRIGVSQSTVSKRVSLLKLDTAGQEAVDAGVATQTSAVASTGRKRSNGAPKPRGVLELNAGTVKVKRGRTLAELHAELTARLNAGQGERSAA